MFDTKPNIQSGFTLVELIAVIIVIGILAAVALPKLISLGSEARIASINTLAGALRSTSNTWYLVCRTQQATFQLRQHIMAEYSGLSRTKC